MDGNSALSDDSLEDVFLVRLGTTADNITLERLYIHDNDNSAGGGANGSGTWEMDGIHINTQSVDADAPTNIKIRHCWITKVDDDGIDLNNVQQGSEVTNNLITVCDDNGIDTEYFDDTIIRNNTIDNVEGHGIELEGTSAVDECTGNIVTGNIIKDIGSTTRSGEGEGDSGDDFYAIFLANASENIISNNIIDDTNHGTGIALMTGGATGYCTNNLVSGNSIDNISGPSVNAYGIEEEDSNHDSNIYTGNRFGSVMDAGAYEINGASSLITGQTQSLNWSDPVGLLVDAADRYANLAGAAGSRVGFSQTRGLRTKKAGFILSIEASVDWVTADDGDTLNYEIWVDGSPISSAELTITSPAGTGDVSGDISFAPTTIEFAADKILSVYLDVTDDGGGVAQVDNMRGSFTVQYYD